MFVIFLWFVWQRVHLIHRMSHYVQVPHFIHLEKKIIFGILSFRLIFKNFHSQAQSSDLLLVCFVVFVYTNSRSPGRWGRALGSICHEKLLYFFSRLQTFATSSKQFFLLTNTYRRLEKQKKSDVRLLGPHDQFARSQQSRPENGKNSGKSHAPIAGIGLRIAKT